MESIIIDVRTREEFVKEHIKGAINIPFYDLEFYRDFLQDKKLCIYCNSGKRTLLAIEKLKRMGIGAEPIKNPETFDKEGKNIICAVNHVEVRPGSEEKFEELARTLCSDTENFEGFLGSKFMRVSGISSRGSGLKAGLNDMKIFPVKYLFITYWETKEHHEKSHSDPVFLEAFKKIAELLAKPPFEEFFEVIK